jgi:hypothetical protein
MLPSPSPLPPPSTLPLTRDAGTPPPPMLPTLALAFLLLLALAVVCAAYLLRRRAADIVKRECPWLKAAGGDGVRPPGGAPAAAAAAAAALRSRGALCAMVCAGFPFPALDAAEDELLDELRHVPDRLKALLPPSSNGLGLGGEGFAALRGAAAVGAGEAHEGLRGALEELHIAAKLAGGALEMRACALLNELDATEEAATKAAKRVLEVQPEVGTSAQLEELKGAVTALRERLELAGLRGGSPHRALETEERALAAWAAALEKVDNAWLREATPFHERAKSPFAGEMGAILEAMRSRDDARLLLPAMARPVLLENGGGGGGGGGGGAAAAPLPPAGSADAGAATATAAAAAAPVLRVLCGQEGAPNAARSRAAELRDEWGPLRERLAALGLEERQAHDATGQRLFSNTTLRSRAERALNLVKKLEDELEEGGDVEQRGRETLQRVAGAFQNTQLVVARPDGADAGAAPQLPQAMLAALVGAQPGPLGLFLGALAKGQELQMDTTSAVNANAASTARELQNNRLAVDRGTAVAREFLDDGRRREAEADRRKEASARSAQREERIQLSMFFAALAFCILWYRQGGSSAVVRAWVDVDKIRACAAGAFRPAAGAPPSVPTDGGGWLPSWAWPSYRPAAGAPPSVPTDGGGWLPSWAWPSYLNLMFAPVVRFFTGSALSCGWAFAKAVLLLLFCMWLARNIVGPLLRVVIDGSPYLRWLCLFLLLPFSPGRAVLWVVVPHWVFFLLAKWKCPTKWAPLWARWPLLALAMLAAALWGAFVGAYHASSDPWNGLVGLFNDAWRFLLFALKRKL